VVTFLYWKHLWFASRHSWWSRSCCIESISAFLYFLLLYMFFLLSVLACNCDVYTFVAVSFLCLLLYVTFYCYVVIENCQLFIYSQWLYFCALSWLLLFSALGYHGVIHGSWFFVSPFLLSMVGLFNQGLGCAPVVLIHFPFVQKKLFDTANVQRMKSLVL